MHGPLMGFRRFGIFLSIANSEPKLLAGFSGIDFQFCAQLLQSAITSTELFETEVLSFIVQLLANIQTCMPQTWELTVSGQI